MKTISKEQEKINSIATDLESRGYQVIIEPNQHSLQNLPFDLGNYRPDLIAFKDQGGCVVEVKSRRDRISVERFQEIAQQIGQYPNWRFLIATLDDLIDLDFVDTAHDLPDWQELQKRLETIEQLLKDSLLEPAFLYLWSLIEVSLRKQAIAAAIAIERWSLIKLIRYMYDMGELSLETYETLESFIPLRNKVAHGLGIVLDRQDCKKLLDLSRGLLTQWTQALSNASRS